MEALKNFILSKLMIFSFNEYEGTNDLSLVELYQLKGIIEGVISSIEYPSK